MEVEAASEVAVVAASEVALEDLVAPAEEVASVVAEEAEDLEAAASEAEAASEKTVVPTDHNAPSQITKLVSLASGMAQAIRFRALNVAAWRKPSGAEYAM